MLGLFKKKQALPEHERGSGNLAISALLLEGNSFPAAVFLKELARGGSPARWSRIANLWTVGRLASTWATSLLPAA